MNGIQEILLNTPLPVTLSIVLNLVLIASIKFFFYPAISEKEKLVEKVASYEAQEKQAHLEAYENIRNQYVEIKKCLTESGIADKEKLNMLLAITSGLVDLKRDIDSAGKGDNSDISDKLVDINRQCQSLIQTQATLTGVLLGGSALPVGHVSLSGVK